MSEEKNIILNPHDQVTASPIFLYTFANIDEINYFIKQAQAETIDSLFLKHKSGIIYTFNKLCNWVIYIIYVQPSRKHNHKVNRN